MKKRFWLVLVLAMLALAGCVDDGPKTMVDLRFDEGDFLALRQGWYLEDGPACFMAITWAQKDGKAVCTGWTSRARSRPACGRKLAIGLLWRTSC